MPKEKPVRLTPKARERLINIGLYSQENWGIRKRDAYLEGLFETIFLIGKFPLIGQPKPNIAKDLRSIIYESHIIHYRIYQHHVGIIDILHKNMNQSQDTH